MRTFCIPRKYNEIRILMGLDIFRNYDSEVRTWLLRCYSKVININTVGIPKWHTDQVIYYYSVEYTKINEVNENINLSSLS